MNEGLILGGISSAKKVNVRSESRFTSVHHIRRLLYSTHGDYATVKHFEVGVLWR